VGHNAVALGAGKYVVYQEFYREYILLGVAVVVFGQYHTQEEAMPKRITHTQRVSEPKSIQTSIPLAISGQWSCKLVIIHYIFLNNPNWRGSL